jgi:DNA-binding NtrC family response regulator
VDEEKVTERGHRRGVYVLVVRDENIEAPVLSQALDDEFVVRVATNATDIAERLSSVTLTCVVCVLGGNVRARGFFELVTRVAPAQATRLVFVASEESSEDEAFLQQAKMNWIAASASPEEILAVVRAVSARR